jgi:hypothetical protein
MLNPPQILFGLDHLGIWCNMTKKNFNGGGGGPAPLFGRLLLTLLSFFFPRNPLTPQFTMNRFKMLQKGGNPIRCIKVMMPLQQKVSLYAK